MTAILSPNSVLKLRQEEIEVGSGKIMNIIHRPTYYNMKTLVEEGVNSSKHISFQILLSLYSLWPVLSEYYQDFNA